MSKTWNLDQIEKVMKPSWNQILWTIHQEKEATVEQIVHLTHYRIQRIRRAINRFLEFGLIEFTGSQAIVLTEAGKQYIYDLV